MTDTQFLLEFDMYLNRIKAKKRFNYFDGCPLLYKPAVEQRQKKGFTPAEAIEDVFREKIRNARVIEGHLQPSGSY